VAFYLFGLVLLLSGLAIGLYEHAEQRDKRAWLTLFWIGWGIWTAGFAVRLIIVSVRAAPR
jgi:hypothetical protein